MSGSILIVEDEPHIRRLLRNALAEQGTVLEAATGQDGIDLAAADRPSLIVLDLGLPDVPGVKVCQEVRKWSTVPIIVLSAHQSDSEKVALLNAGADDYVVKPFSTSELQARVRAQLRRAGLVDAASSAPLEVGGIVVDVARRTVARSGSRVHLTPTEWDLLRMFVRHAGRTLTHEQIFREVWGGAGAGDAQAYLRVHIANLRRKIEQDPARPSLIVTEPGVGYRFDAGD
jgi:two-component system KDP operon response regulator KdpE